MSDLIKLFDRALQAEDENRTDEALDLYKQVLAVQPDNIGALFNSALLQENRFLLVEAAESYRRLASLSPDSVTSNLLHLCENARKHSRIYHLAGIELMQQCRFIEALQFFKELSHNSYSLTGQLHRPTLYYTGLCCLYLNEPVAAIEPFNILLQMNPQHVDAWFNLGNAYQMAGNDADAAQCYLRALALEPDFAEAFYNYSLPLRSTDVDMAENYFSKALQLNPKLQLPGGEVSRHAPKLKGRYWKECRPPEKFWDIPIFINCRDRLSPLKHLLQWLLGAGYTNIILLDNDSTYPPLLAFYHEIQSEARRVQVVMLKQNLGHQALWRSHILQKLDIKTAFVYSDSDIVPVKECPDDVLKVFWQILAHNPFVQKVGFGLKIDDIPEHNAKKSEIQGNEVNYWLHRLPGKAPEQYLAQIDTTFALYRHGNYYEIPHSIRTGPPYVARHTDWYLDTNNLDTESAYYFEYAAPESSSTKKTWNL